MANEHHTFEPKPARPNRGRDQGMGAAERGIDAEGETATETPLLDRNPEEDWGEPADPGATYSANHATRARKAVVKHSQGAKTRTATKDQISRR